MSTLAILGIVVIFCRAQALSRKACLKHVHCARFFEDNIVQSYFYTRVNLDTGGHFQRRYRWIMTQLPPGWWVKNAQGSFEGPPPLEDLRIRNAAEDEDTDDEMADGDGLDIQPDSPGWEDMESDTETVAIQCLLCDQQFPAPTRMLRHCKHEHGFDFVAVVNEHKLDFYKAIKYINLIRSRVKSSVQQPESLEANALDSDDLLKPVLENDALLFSLDDVIDFESSLEQNGHEGMTNGSTGP
jgi:hypothetical protein